MQMKVKVKARKPENSFLFLVITLCPVRFARCDSTDELFRRPVSALFSWTFDRRTALPRLFDQEGGVAEGTLFGDGFVPEGIGTGGVVAAAVKGPPFAASPFHDHPATPFLRATDACLPRLGELAGRVIRACQESPELAVLNRHGAPAQIALRIGLFPDLPVSLHFSRISAFGIARTGQEEPPFSPALDHL